MRRDVILLWQVFTTTSLEMGHQGKRMKMKLKTINKAVKLESLTQISR